MIAIINGVTVEGTAQEVAEYKRLVDEQDRAKRSVSIPHWSAFPTEITRMTHT